MKEFMDRLVASYNEISELNKGYNDEEISICSPFGSSGVHIYCGLDKIANEFGLEIGYTFRNEEHYPYEAYITYNNVRFFQLVQEKGDFTK